MPRFFLKVPDNDEGEYLGEYESDYLPRVGEDFAVWHPRLCADPHQPFLGIVREVTHEARYSEGADNFAVTTVWLDECFQAPTLYCACAPEELRKFASRAGQTGEFAVDEDGTCKNCGGKARAAK